MPRGQSGVPGQELAADFLERWNRQARSINRQLHALAATEGAVDNFSTDFLARDGLHLNVKGNRGLLRGITGAIHHIHTSHPPRNYFIYFRCSGLAIVNHATKNTASPIDVQNTNTSRVCLHVCVHLYVHACMCVQVRVSSPVRFKSVDKCCSLLITDCCPCSCTNCDRVSVRQR